MQNLRARPYDPASGRFIGLDPFSGNMQDPQSLHKYAYVHGDPVTFVDPTGLLASLFGASEWGLKVDKEIARIYKRDHGADDTSRSGRWTKIGPAPAPGTIYLTPLLYRAKVDLLNKTTKKYAEVKPFSLSGIIAGEAQLALRALQFSGTGYGRDVNWMPSQMISFAGGQFFVFVNIKGLVVYSDKIDLLQDMLAATSIALAKQYVSQNVLRMAIGRISVALAGFAGSQQTQMNGRVSLAASLRIG